MEGAAAEYGKVNSGKYVDLFSLELRINASVTGKFPMHAISSANRRV
jgi:hypothetical protein